MTCVDCVQFLPALWLDYIAGAGELGDFQEQWGLSRKSGMLNAPLHASTRLLYCSGVEKVASN